LEHAATRMRGKEREREREGGAVLRDWPIDSSVLYISTAAGSTRTVVQRLPRGGYTVLKEIKVA